MVSNYAIKSIVIIEFIDLRGASNLDARRNRPTGLTYALHYQTFARFSLICDLSAGVHCFAV